MQTPSNINQIKKKRIHLSPIFITSDQSNSNVRFRGLITADDSVKSPTKNTYGNLSTFNENDIKKQIDSKENQTIYDDRYIPQPIRNIPAARDNISGKYDHTEPENNFISEDFRDDQFEKLKTMSKAVLGEETEDMRVLKFTESTAKTDEKSIAKTMEGLKNRVLKPKWKVKRCIPSHPERVLDAPELINDYYLNVIHWGGDNMLSIGLGSTVYVWNGNNAQVNRVEPPVDLPTDTYVSSVQWSGYSSSSCLSIAYSSGIVKLFDISSLRCLRTLRECRSRVASMSWSESILSCGSRSGLIYNYDVRMQHSRISTFSSHTREVCGLTWSPDGQYLASGANDNQVYVHDRAAVTSNGIYSQNFNFHNAAVKALAWHPTQAHVLVTGGGTADHNINFWNVYNGCRLACLPVNSQISGIVWNPHSNEFVTSHGNPHNQLTLWSYPSMEISAHLTSHVDRVLGLTLSPDGTTVASVGADETLRLWRCFEPQEKKDPSMSNDLQTKVPLGIR